MTDAMIPLTGAALKEWQRHGRSDRVWTPAQSVTLAAYCAVYGRWVEAERWLADPEHGPVITIRDDKGNIKSHGPAPQLLIAERSAKEMQRLKTLLRIV